MRRSGRRGLGHAASARRLASRPPSPTRTPLRSHGRGYVGCTDHWVHGSFATVRSMNHEAAIEVEQLVREFRKGPRAVDGIDLTVSPGEIYGFLGPNGAGKSTTVLVLTTLLPPTSGRATAGGFDLVRQGAHVREAIGPALQDAALDV